MGSRCNTDMVMDSTRSGQGVGLRGNGVQVLGNRGFLMIALLLVTATTFVIQDVHCSISTVAIAPARKPSTQQTGDIVRFNRYEEDALNAVFKLWSNQNPQLSTLLNWSLEVHPCNLTETILLSGDYPFQGAWGGVGCVLELQNITEFAKYYRASVRSLDISGSNLSCTAEDGLLRRDNGIPCGFDGIIGELPPEISNLTNLEYLTINYNPRLTGRVPIQLFQMPNLSELDLSNNNLSGTLPSDVYNTDCRLYALDLSNNNFSGRLPVSSNGTFFSSPYLYDLNVGYNQLDGPIDLQNWKFQRSNYFKLNFSNNRFRGIFSINSNITIWNLDLSCNDFSNIQFTNHSKFTQINGSGIIFMQSLSYLNISNNNFSGSFLEELFQLPSLLKLDLSMNYFGGSIDFGSLNETTRLYHLNISNNNFNGTFFVGAYPNASIVDLSNNQFDKITFPVLNKTTPSNGNVFLPFLNQMNASQNEYHSLQLPILQIDNFSLSQVFITNNKLGAAQYPKSGPLSFDNLQFLSLLFLGGNPMCNKIENMILSSICRMNQTDEPKPEFDKKEVKPNLYSYREVKMATNNFDKDNKLGEGGFGVVYKGELFDGTQVAVKKLTKSSKQVLHEFLNEVIVISGLKHRNLVKLKGCCLGDGDQRILVFEYVEKNNLAEALWMHGDLQSNIEPPCLDWEKRFNIIVDVARGLAYLHDELQSPIIHRDIKATNILLDKNYNAKIADFGLAYLFPALDGEVSHLTLMQVAGTRRYFSPEYALQGHVSTSLDVYSFGILVLEIVSGRKNIDLQKPSEEIYLREWAWKQYEAKATMTLIDPKMEHSPSALK